jgi:RING finger protein 121
MLLMTDFFGVSLLFPAYLSPASPVAFMWLFYGMYFGVLGRDCANFITEALVTKIGYYSKDGIPSKQLGENVCAVCDTALYNLRQGPQPNDEEVYTLSCKHQFHESCVKGWLVVGKRDTCPNCSEKVQLREIFKNPWETQNLAWGKILNALRFLLVYNPIVVALVQAAIYVFY